MNSSSSQTSCLSILTNPLHHVIFIDCLQDLNSQTSVCTFETRKNLWGWLLSRAVSGRIESWQWDLVDQEDQEDQEALADRGVLALEVLVSFLDLVGVQTVCAAWSPLGKLNLIYVFCVSVVTVDGKIYGLIVCVNIAAYTVSAAVGCYKIASVEPVAPTVHLAAPRHSDFFTVGRSVDIFLRLFAARFSFGDPMAPFTTLMACCYFFCLRKLLPTYVVALSVDY